MYPKFILARFKLFKKSLYLCYIFNEKRSQKKEINESYFLALFTSQDALLQSVKIKAADNIVACCLYLKSALNGKQKLFRILQVTDRYVNNILFLFTGFFEPILFAGRHHVFTKSRYFAQSQISPSYNHDKN